MSYIPIITPTTAESPNDTDHRDLITALKLLSGEDCLRDVRQAQTMLVGLTESRHDEVVDDARAVLKTGLAEGWFENTVPKYYTLCNLAERSIAQYKKGANNRQKQVQIVMLVIGLAVLLMTGMVLFIRTTNPGPQPWILIALVGLLVVSLGIGFLSKTKNT